MALNKREMTILWVTILIIAGVVLWVYAFEPVYQSYSSILADLEKEEKLFKSNVSVLEDTKKIEEDYKRIEATFPKDNPDKLPEMQFSEDVDAAAEAILPGEKRNIEPVQHADIKDVTGYEFLTLAMRTQGEYHKISQLLTGFDQKGFLMKSITLQRPNIDRPDMTLDVTLARIVKLQMDDESNRSRGGKRGARRSRGQ